MKPVHRQSQHRERGTALIELAAILPLLTLLLIGIVNMGFVIREHQILQNAAREGARYSTLQANRIDEAGDATAQAALLTKLKTRVQRYLAQERITIALSDVTIDQNYTYPADASTTVTASKVTVSYSRSTLIPAGWLWPFGSVTLTGQAVFRNLY
jgi:Flp pilus assembly protein TadG